MLMGNLNIMHVEIISDADKKGELPLFRQAQQLGYASVCGDSVEYRLPVKSDTIQLGSNRLQFNFDIPVQSFDSGYYHLPPLLYVTGSDTVCSNALTLRVLPVKAKADDEISPFAGVAQPEERSIFDYLPDWLVEWWWLILISLLIVGVTVFAVMKYRQKGEIFIKPQIKVPDPWVVALDKLSQLKQRKLWEKGNEKEYFTELTEILRVYLVKRFNINAMEMTSREIMDSLRNNSELRDKREYVRKILDMADFVKFAKVRPLPEDNTLAYDNAVKFVEATVPDRLAEDDDNASTHRKGVKQ